MPLINWSPILEVGVKEIDSQHAKLVEILNELWDAFSQKQSKEVLGKVFNKLIAYTRTHFTHEESLMRKFDYQESPGHMQEHKILTDQVVDLQAKFHSGESTVDKETLQFLKEWLQHHIMNVDKNFGRYLNARGQY